MSVKQPYTYTVLRYVHDVVTGEFVNVGVVFYLPRSNTLRISTRTTITRIKSVFPDLDRYAFTSAMRSVRRGIQKVANSLETEGFLKSEGDAGVFARAVLPPDESTLQWSPTGSGITDNPDEALARIYERFVGRYDRKLNHRRSDDEVWRPVRRKLEERNINAGFQEKIIRGGLDDILFKHAWKNGVWNVYEPVSFDLADSDGIKSKAREWFGHLAAVTADGPTELFKAHFLVGAPHDPKLSSAYRAAVEMLRHAPGHGEVFEESEIDKLVDKIEDDVRSHIATFE
jgi:hypothetical protein